jgi:CheY-like chemotaxis protein
MSRDPADTRLSVLYIEDNPSNLQLVKRIFRDRDDVELLAAARGQEGIEMAKTELPGLILLDLHLPDMLGADVLDTLRSDERTAAIPVVVVSADATGDQIRRLRANGVADYVTKPFEVTRLLAVVDSFVAHEPARAEAILDPDRVAELSGLDGDGEAFRSLATVALGEAADQIAAISAAPIAGRGATAVVAAAHNLKSSAAIVGARRLAALADAVEQAARAGSLPDPPMLSELRSTLAATGQAVNDVAGAR